jgi:hypothetical protein
MIDPSPSFRLESPLSKHNFTEDPMHALLITLLLASDAPTPDIGHAVQTIELSKLKWDQARQLDSQRVRIVFKIESVALSTAALSRCTVSPGFTLFPLF